MARLIRGIAHLLSSEPPTSHHAADSAAAAASAPAGPFDLLLGDLICLVCMHLETRDLVALRRTNQHWSRFSRLNRSWSFSAWYLTDLSDAKMAASWLSLGTFCDAVPHLRALRLPGQTGEVPATLHEVDRLQSLEMLHFENVSLSAELVRCLPNLRHVGSCMTLTGQEHETMVIDELGGKSGLLSIPRVSGEALARLGLSSIASRSILALEVNATRGFFELAPFSALEVLDMIFYVGREGVEALRALGSAPALRVLTIRTVITFRALEDGGDSVTVDGSQVDALLSNSTLARRLEYLALNSCVFGRDSVRHILEECTSLLVLHIAHRSGCFRPVTEEEWLVMRSDPTLNPVQMRARAAAREAKKGLLRRTMSQVTSFARTAKVFVSGARTRVQEPLEVDSLDLGLFLQGPPAFRQRLLSLSLMVNWNFRGTIHTDVQLRRRMPNLVHLQTAPSDLPPMPPRLAATIDPWLDQVPSDRSAPLHGFPDQQRTDFSSPFQFVRRLKQMAGLPLTASEKNPHTRWI